MEEGIAAGGAQRPRTRNRMHLGWSVPYKLVKVRVFLSTMPALDSALKKYTIEEQPDA